MRVEETVVDNEEDYAAGFESDPEEPTNESVDEQVEVEETETEEAEETEESETEETEESETEETEEESEDNDSKSWQGRTERYKREADEARAERDRLRSEADTLRSEEDPEPADEGNKFFQDFPDYQAPLTQAQQEIARVEVERQMLIYTMTVAHPEWRDYANPKTASHRAFKQWMYSLPDDLYEKYSVIEERGSAPEMVGMLNEFKKAKVQVKPDKPGNVSARLPRSKSGSGNAANKRKASSYEDGFNDPIEGF